MAHTIEIDQDIYNTLVDMYGKETLTEKFNSIIISGIGKSSR